MHYVYILTDPKNYMLYTGVTPNLKRRLHELKNRPIVEFAQKYDTTKLVYFEKSVDRGAAVAKENELKRCTRAQKEQIIAAKIPNWDDLIGQV